MYNQIKIDEIYTYENPFEIDKISNWRELKRCPHLCISQTLVEGLKEYYGRSEFQLICTVDSVLKKVYEEWHDSPEAIIQQKIIMNIFLTIVKNEEN